MCKNPSREKRKAKYEIYKREGFFNSQFYCRFSYAAVHRLEYELQRGKRGISEIYKTFMVNRLCLRKNNLVLSMQQKEDGLKKAMAAGALPAIYSQDQHKKAADIWDSVTFCVAILIALSRTLSEEHISHRPT